MEVVILPKVIKMLAMRRESDQIYSSSTSGGHHDSNIDSHDISGNSISSQPGSNGSSLRQIGVSDHHAHHLHHLHHHLHTTCTTTTAPSLAGSIYASTSGGYQQCKDTFSLEFRFKFIFTTDFEIISLLSQRI